MKKKIIWHLGFRKTGTTSIQYLLDHLPAESHPDLFVSPRDHLTRAWRQLIVAATTTRTRPDLTKVRAEIAKVAAELRAAPQNTILVSDENLFAFSLFAPDGSHFFDWAAEVLPLIEAEFPDFENVFFAYTRPLENWLKSSYSQEVKRGRTWRTYETWRKQVPESCNWTDGLATIRAAIRSPLVMIKQTDDLDQGLPLGAGLLEFAGIPRADVVKLGPAPRLNEGLSSTTMRMFRLFNFIGLNGFIRSVVKRRFRARELSRYREEALAADARTKQLGAADEAKLKKTEK